MENKVCRNCDENKSITEYHKHNGNYRLDCKICFREQEKIRRVNRLLKIDINHANRVILHQKEFKDRGECPIDNTWCYDCKSYKHNTNFSPTNLKNNGRCTECSSEYDIQRNRLLKLKCIEYLGGSCSKCGFIGNYSSYDFHHNNYKEKEFNWNVGRKKSFNNLLPELDKCTLLCRNCHQMIHTKLNNDGSLNPYYIPTNI